MEDHFVGDSSALSSTYTSIPFVKDLQIVSAILDLTDEALLRERGIFKRKAVEKFHQSVFRNALARKNNLNVIAQIEKEQLQQSPNFSSGLSQLPAQLQTQNMNISQVVEQYNESTADNSIDESASKNQHGGTAAIDLTYSLDEKLCVRKDSLGSGGASEENTQRYSPTSHSTSYFIDALSSLDVSLPKQQPHKPQSSNCAMTDRRV